MDPNSWTDHGRIGIRSDSSKPYNAIDPNFFIDTDGSKYIVFGSFWQDIFQVPMNAAGTKVSSALSNIAYDPTGAHAVEGAYLYKHGKWYYLFFSVGVCCGYDRDRPAAGKEYKIKVCRSDSVAGKFVRLFSFFVFFFPSTCCFYFCCNFNF
jgi:arabinan endo-1,5-alpha-L-arabinosidase